MKPGVITIGPNDCPICGNPCRRGQRLVEVKHRLCSKVYPKGNWVKAHLYCAKHCPGENSMLPPRKIRSLKTKKRIKPAKAVGKIFRERSD